MSNVIGRGVIEVSADASKLKAGIEDAKRSIKGLGISTAEVTKSSSASIDKYVRGLGVQAVTLGKSTRETELYKLALRGATDAQLKAADSSLRMIESHKRNADMVHTLKTGFITLGLAAGAGLIAAAAGLDSLIKKAGDFQDMAEKIGDSAQNVASLAVAANIGQFSMENLVTSVNRLSKNLVGVDDESKAAGAAVKALGINLSELKNQAPTERLVTIAKALEKFEDSGSKAAVVIALMGRSGAEALPFLKELAGETGRQVILTEKQIKQADEYADRQARFKAQISLQAQAIATELLPVLSDFTKTISDLVQDQNTATIAMDLLKGAAQSAVVIFQTLAVVGSDVGFVFLGLGREIGAWAAQIKILASAVGRIWTLDVKGFTAISDAVKEDGIRARKELDAFQAKVMSIGNGSSSGTSPSGTGDKPPVKKRKLVYNGPTDSSSIKSRLDYDLAQMRASYDQLIGMVSGAEKIVQTLHAAGLIDERTYYESKRGFLTINSQAQEDELKKEIARLQKERLVGKDKIENDTKIIETKAKLAKSQSDAVINVEINSIQESSALNKVAQAYRNAEDSAQEYLDTISRSQARDLKGMGAGEVERQRAMGIAQIEDRYSQQRRDLERSRRDAEMSDTFTPQAQQKYDDELDRIRRFQGQALSEYDAYFSKRLKQEGDWSIGASEAMKNYYDQSRNIAGQVEEIFTKAFKEMEDALVSFVTTGKLDFKSLADSIVADITRIIIKQQLAGMMGSSGGGDFLGFFSKLLGGSSSSSVLPGSASTMLNANGNVFNSQSLSAYSGRVYDTPRLFTFAKGVGVFAEAGAEAIMPLKRGKDGKLGVSAEGTAQPEGGGLVVHNHFVITGPVDHRNQGQIAAAAYEGVVRASRRNG